MQSEKTDEILDGVIYSTMSELGPKPQVWFPERLDYKKILEITIKFTSYLSVGGEDWTGKISILPFPAYRVLGLSYFFEELPDNPSRKATIATITLLINENSSNFFYQNMDKLKQDLEALSEELKIETKRRRLVLSRFYFNLVEFIGRYEAIQKITDVKEMIEESGKNCVLLSFFHSKIGPKPFYCYPEGVLSEEQQYRTAKELELNFEQGFFTRSYPDFKVLHYYFELPSEWARGKSEMCLVSLIFGAMPPKETINLISFRLADAIDKLLQKPNISKGFYKVGYGIKDNLDEIDKMHDFLQNWVTEVYKICIEEYQETSSEVKLANILRDYNRVKLMEKLSEGSMELQELQQWISLNLGKNVDPLALIQPLVDSNFALVNEISGQNHIILLKEIQVFRISPSSTLEKLKSLEIIYPDLLELYEAEVQRFFRRYKPSLRDTVFLSRLIFDSVNYHIISMLREGGAFLKTDFEEAISKDVREIALANMEFLKDQNILAEIDAHNEHFILLKTDIKFMATIPKYLLAEKKDDRVVPDALGQALINISKAPDRIRNIFRRWFA
ncbi:MAG: hypothetical protein EU536_04695 [Promethearchaeota archaeon]|nr:MAG: hypothetical protein EU536_04695 [Candidatus Lokiarchaeota archaeon]